jgi:hypothetical protein
VRSSLTDKIVEYFTPDSRPYCLTYGQWTVKWWQWLVSIPTDNSPAADETGIHAAVNQTDPSVWFLAGTFGGKSVYRKCAIPAGRSVLFPVINYEMNAIERPDLKRDPDLIRHVVEDEDDVLNLQCIIDSQTIQVYRVSSDPIIFPITIHENNPFNTSGGTTTRATSDGYWVFLKSLEPGEHDLYFAGSCSSGIRNVRARYGLRVLSEESKIDKNERT